MNTEPTPSASPDEHHEPLHHLDEAFAQSNVAQLRYAVAQAVYGEVSPEVAADPDKAHTIEVLTTLGQMGELTEMDIDEAKKEYK